MPSVRLAPGDLHLSGKVIAKFIAPSSDRFVAHHDAALEQQFFVITKAQRKAKIPAYREADDGRREAMADVNRRGFHASSLPDPFDNLIMDRAIRSPMLVCVPLSSNLSRLSLQVISSYRYRILPMSRGSPGRFNFFDVFGKSIQDGLFHPKPR